IVERSTVPRFERQLAQSARDIAYSVSEIPEIKKYIDWPDGDQITQPIVNRIMKRADVRYILTIGGADAKPVIEGFPYSTFPEVTTLGPTLRAYVPVTRDGRKVGAVAVYLWTHDVNILIWSLRRKIIMAVVFGLVIGIFFAHLLAKNIKNSMFGMEPHKIASLLQEREVLLESVKEGILAIDYLGNILFMNRKARELFGLSPDEDIEGKPVELYVTNSRLKRVVEKGEAEYDQEQFIGDHSIITNRIPIRVGGQVYAAIASFRSVDEMRDLAEELTGARKLADVLRVQNEALRVQKHEFLNKLHTISGLVQLGDYTDALNLIQNESHLHQESIQFVTAAIQKPAVAGLILGKMGRCRELGIQFHLSEQSRLGPVSKMDDESMIVCMGNLIENAMEAVLSENSDLQRVNVLVQQSDNNLLIEIEDSGPGIPEDLVSRIFTKGYTSKKGEKRGYGLFLVRSIVDSYGGTISVDNKLNNGTIITMIIPEGEGHV
ncbi:MAG: sensor histidine kinase, partial [Synergistales bacterium]|nr:sensor histidine kinase [Synergistales bacterium]